ncbi:MAG: ankyrin repeat domain-containing protein [Victivallales bacterium]|jgi:ankyrin repeat protein
MAISRFARMSVFVLIVAALNVADVKAQSPKLDQVVSELISSKGTLNQRYDFRFNKDDNGIPILISAVTQKNADAVAILLKNGADPNIEKKKGGGETALFLVAVSLDDEPDAKIRDEICAKTMKICELLLDAKANANLRNRIDSTPLSVAATKGRADICALLISRGADVNAQNRVGETPLFKAAQGGYWKVVELLLKNKAKISSDDKLMSNPLKAAEERSDEKLHKSIRQKLGKSYYIDADYDKTIDILRKAAPPSK